MRRVWSALLTTAISALSPVFAERVPAHYNAGPAGNPEMAPSPATQGWTAVTPTSDQANFRSEPLSPDGESGLNAWRTLDDSTSTGQFVHWTHPLDAADIEAATTHGWTLATRLRVSDPVAGNAGTRSVTLFYGNGTRRWILFFDINADGRLVVTFDSSSMPIVLEDLDPSAYHEHQLIAPAGGGAVEYWVNGVRRFSGYAGAGSSFRGIQFGTGSSSGRGEGNWNEVAFAVREPVIRGPAPVLTSSPRHVIAATGSDASLEAVFAGEVTEYQWFKNGQAIDGARSAVLRFEGLAARDGGDYWCRASNGPEQHAYSRSAAVLPLVNGAGLRLSAFLASNESGPRDEDGERVDWIEIFNADTEPRSTAGWHLSDDPARPLRWAFPDFVMAPGEFRVIHASGKNRRDPAGPWHSDFSLSASGEEILLGRPDGTLASHVIFGPQTADVSQGASNENPSVWLFYDKTQPGVPQVDGRSIASNPIHFDPAPGVFASTTQEIRARAEIERAEARLHFTTDGSRPHADSPVWDGALAVQANQHLRVSQIAPGERYGVGRSAAYLWRAEDAADFRSPLPLLVLSNFGAGEVPGISARGPNGDGSQVVQVEPQEQILTLLAEADGTAAGLGSPLQVQSRAGLRRRGSSSFSFSRRSYRLFLRGEIDTENRNLSLLGMPAEHDWVLYAPDPSQFDITLLHNAFTYELARRSGFPAPRFQLVELFLDTDGDGRIGMSDHRGLHLLTETVKRDSARVAFEPLSDHGRQGGWMVGIDRMDSLPPGSDPATLRPRQFHSAGPDGVLQTADDVARGTGTADDQPNFYHSFFNFVSPAGWDILPAQREAIQRTIRDFDVALYGPEFQDLQQGWAAHIDAVNWSHHLALHQLARNQDAVVLSSFLMRESPAAPLRWASLWDFDRAYARMGSATSNLTWAQDRMYYPRLMQDPEFRQIHVDTWQELRRGAFATAEMHALLDELAGRVTAEVAARSGISAQAWQSNLAAMKSWLASRAAAIDALAPPPPVFSIPGGPLQPGLLLEMTTAAGEIHYTTDGRDPRQRGGEPSPVSQIASAPLAIAAPWHVTARSRLNGQWSGPVRAVFFPAEDGPAFLPSGDAGWNVDSHWESSLTPNGPGQAALLRAPTASRNVTLTAPVSLGNLHFDLADSPFRNRLRGGSPNEFRFLTGTDQAARLRVAGSGPGFVEFDLDAGVRLESDLTLDIAHGLGDPEFGALRLRGTWSGPGGLRKTGIGIASLTGAGKQHQGRTEVGQGVLRITANAWPAMSSELAVSEGGQVRLVSDGNALYPSQPALVLAGHGRGTEIPDLPQHGREGALRYDPATQGNQATLPATLLLRGESSIHVEGGDNRLVLSGALAGTADMVKTGTGQLEIVGDASGFAGSIDLQAGSLLALVETDMPVRSESGSLLLASGRLGQVIGAGILRTHAGQLDVAGIDGPALEIPFLPGRFELRVQNAFRPSAVDIFLREHPQAPGTRWSGGILLRDSAAWDHFDVSRVRVFVPDPTGSRWYEGRNWSALPQVSVARMPHAEGSALELRFDASATDYESWVSQAFPPAELAENPNIADPAAKPFGDGVANLLRFALGVNETGRVRLPTWRKDVPSGVFLFRFPYDPGLRGLHWIVEASESPAERGGWNVLFDSRQAMPDHARWDNGELEIALPAGAEAPSSRFLRLRVVQVSQSPAAESIP